MNSRDDSKRDFRRVPLERLVGPSVERRTKCFYERHEIVEGEAIVVQIIAGG